MQMVSDDDVVFRRVAELIRADTAFTAEVLTLVNSPLLGCRQEIGSILHAVAILGLERVKSLVMTVALRDMLSASLGVPALHRCWRHCLACALIAEEFAAAAWLDKDKAYTAGLLHDAGRLGLLMAYPDDYTRLLEIADSTGRDVRVCENAFFGMDHCEAGKELVAEWRLPPGFTEIALHHHDPITADERVEFLQIVKVACRTADILGFQVAGPAAAATLDELRAAAPESFRDRLRSERALMLSIAGKINAVECSLI